jgi:hypothetical protein
MFIFWQISFASAGFAFPEKTFISRDLAFTVFILFSE